jgi:hypothetical protein
MTTTTNEPAATNTAAMSMSDQIRQDIDATLEVRRAAPNTTLRTLEDGAKSAGKHAWVLLQKHPYAGMVALAALGVLAASSVGVGELAVGLGIAYATYNVIKGRETPLEACKQVIDEIERV